MGLSLIVHAAGTVVALVALILIIVSMATTKWTEAKNFDIETGLFKGCISGVCTDLDDPESELEATRAMVILGMIASIAGIALAAVSIAFQVMGKAAHKLMAFAAAGAFFAAALFVMIGLIVYAEEIYDPLSASVDLGSSFNLAIAATVLHAVAGGLVIVAAVVLKESS